MDIYKLKGKELKKELRNFTKTEYGQIVAVHAYIVPVMLLLLFLVVAITSLKLWSYNIYFVCGLFFVGFPLTLIGMLVSFIMGNAYFYKELRIYLKEKKN